MSLTWLAYIFLYLSPIYRKDSVCVTGNIILRVYENMLSGIDKMHYPIFDQAGKDVELTCPHISAFNRTQEIQWFKVGHEENSSVPFALLCLCVCVRVRVCV